MAYKVGIMGATGVVGREVARQLEERNFPVAELHLWASGRSAGTVLPFRGESVEVHELSGSSLPPLDFVFSAVGEKVALEFVPKAVQAGATVIDKSSAFRLHPDVPLVVPEVNPDDVWSHKGIVACPNCSTIQLVVALKPIADAAGLEKVVVSTYQSVSGTGREAVDELREQTGKVLQGGKPEPRIYPHPIAFNLFPHIDSFHDNGYCREELKLVWETRKIMHAPEMAITATVARVPVVVGHSEAVWIRTRSPLSVEAARDTLRKAPGIVVLDDPGSARYPTPLQSEGRDEVFVGRIRADEDDERALWLWVVADNLRKGAATNALQIAELVSRGRQGCAS